MNRALKWKLIAGFLLVFIAGGMSGAFLFAHAHRSFLEWHDPQLVSQHMRQRLRDELQLTPEQMKQIAPIVDRAAAQLNDIRKETGQRVHEAMVQSHKEIAANLTDEQRAKLQTLEAQHNNRWHGRPGPHGMGPPPPPHHGPPAAVSRGGFQPLFFPVGSRPQ